MSLTNLHIKAARLVVLQLVLDQLDHLGQHGPVVELQRAARLAKEHFQDVLLRVGVLYGHLAVVESFLEQVESHKGHRSVGMGQRELQTGIGRS